MRMLISSSIFLFTIALATDTFACDRHGGMFNQFGGASWSDYNPVQTDSDALFTEQQLSEWDKENSIAPSDVKAAKPSFSKASSRASLAAQARLAERAELEKQNLAKTEISAEPKKSTEISAR